MNTKITPLLAALLFALAAAAQDPEARAAAEVRHASRTCAHATWNPGARGMVNLVVPARTKVTIAVTHDCAWESLIYIERTWGSGERRTWEFSSYPPGMPNREGAISRAWSYTNTSNVAQVFLLCGCYKEADIKSGAASLPWLDFTATRTLVRSAAVESLNFDLYHGARDPRLFNTRVQVTWSSVIPAKPTGDG